MKTIQSFLQTHLWKVTTVIFALLLLSRGCVNNKISKLEKDYSENTLKLEKKLDSLKLEVSKMATKKQIQDQMEIVMFNYLIYEDDLDKGKSSLSDIKNKIESND
jgi:outer membrane murein-binding lipoprotein Lpp